MGGHDRSDIGIALRRRREREHATRSTAEALRAAEAALAIMIDHAERGVVDPEQLVGTIVGVREFMADSDLGHIQTIDHEAAEAHRLAWVRLREIEEELRGIPVHRPTLDVRLRSLRTRAAGALGPAAPHVVLLDAAAAVGYGPAMLAAMEALYALPDDQLDKINATRA